MSRIRPWEVLVERGYDVGLVHGRTMVSEGDQLVQRREQIIGTVARDGRAIVDDASGEVIHRRSTGRGRAICGGRAVCDGTGAVVARKGSDYRVFDPLTEAELKPTRRMREGGRDAFYGKDEQGRGVFFQPFWHIAGEDGGEDV